jgi:signal recognition particle subunit SRP54
MEKAFSGTFTLDDFLDQMNMVEKMGGLKDLMAMLPGAGDIGAQMEKAGIDGKFLSRKKAIVLSMTPEERAEPEVMDGSRRRRVAKGSGVPVQDVNNLLKEFRDAREMMKKLGSAQGGALSRMMGRGREKRKKEQFRSLRNRGWKIAPGEPGPTGRQGGK